MDVVTQFANLCIKELGAPESCTELLQDLEVITQLQEFAVKIGDVHIFHEKGHKYRGMAELLDDIDKILQPMDHLQLVENLVSINKGLATNKEWASSVANTIHTRASDLHIAAHKTLFMLVDKLSLNSRKCMKAGKTFKEISDVWIKAIIERNTWYRNVLTM